VVGDAVVGTVVEVRYQPSARSDHPSALVVHDDRADNVLVVPVAAVERLDAERRLVLVRASSRDVAEASGRVWPLRAGATAR
jgi:hypothetical protein